MKTFGEFHFNKCVLIAIGLNSTERYDYYCYVVGSRIVTRTQKHMHTRDERRKNAEKEKKQ